MGPQDLHLKTTNREVFGVYIETTAGLGSVDTKSVVIETQLNWQARSRITFSPDTLRTATSNMFTEHGITITVTTFSRHALHFRVHPWRVIC